MENVVNKIIEIDHQATAKLEQAEAQKESILQQAKVNADQIKGSMSKSAKKRIAKIEQSHKTETDKSIQKLQKRCSQEISTMDLFFESNCDHIANTIFNRIVGE